MENQVLNPRFPHSCRIYRVEGESAFSDGKETVLYEGECRKYGEASRSAEDVANGLFRMSIPGTVGGIIAGDMLDVTDRGATYNRCLIVDYYAGNLGTTIYFNLAMN